MPICKECKIEKTEEEFYVSRPGECRKCCKKFCKKYYAANQERWANNYQANKEKLKKASLDRYYKKKEELLKSKTN